VPRRHQQILLVVLLIAIAHGGGTPDIQPPNTSLPTAHKHTHTHTHERGEGDELYKRFGHRNSECSLTSQHNIRDSIIIIIFNNAMINFIYNIILLLFLIPRRHTRTSRKVLISSSSFTAHSLSLTRTYIDIYISSYSD